MTFNYLEEIENIIKLLRSENLSDFAEKIQEKVDASSNSTELIMSIRYELNQLLKQDIDNLLRNKLCNLTKELDQLIST